MTDELTPELMTALSTYMELTNEITAIDHAIEQARATIKFEVYRMGGKIKVPHMAAISIVPASTSHSYDTKVIDGIIIDAVNNGDLHMASALTAARKTTNRAETMRITLER